MKGKPISQARRDVFRVLFILCVSVFIVTVVAYIYLPDYTRMKELRIKKESLKEEIASLKGDIYDLLRKNKLIENEDSFLLEKLARENLGVVRENEVIVDVRTEVEKGGE